MVQHSRLQNLPRWVKWRKITALGGSRSFKVITFNTNHKPICDFLSLNNSILHPLTSVSNIYRSTGHIFAVNGAGVPLCTHSFEWTCKFRTTKFIFKRLETLFHCVVQIIFRYREPWFTIVTDRLTDRHSRSNAALNYVARSKKQRKLIRICSRLAVKIRIYYLWNECE